MTSLEYILEICDRSAQVLGCPFIKETPKRFQKWVTKNKPPLIALVGLNETSTKVRNTHLPTFDLAFVCIVGTPKDPTNKDMIKAQIEADKLAKEFRYLIDNNSLVNTTNYGSEELFRDGSFNGIGKGFTLSAQLPDLNDYCDLFCNDETKDIDCEN